MNFFRKARPRILLLGDHSGYHCGSAAVGAFLKSTLGATGDLVAEGQPYDCLVINGEGSMHHGSPTFHNKRKALQEAVQSGRKAWLVNTLWQKTPADYDAILPRLQQILVREKA